MNDEKKWSIKFVADYEASDGIIYRKGQTALLSEQETRRAMKINAAIIYEIPIGNRERAVKPPFEKRSA